MRGLLKKKKEASAPVKVPAARGKLRSAPKAPPRKRDADDSDDEKDASGAVIADKRKKTSSAARTAHTDARLDALMKMTGDTGATGKLHVDGSTDRSASINIGSLGKSSSSAFPKKKMSSISEDERRHSLLPTSKRKKKHGLFDRSKKKKPTASGRKKVAYRVEGELYDLYDFYEPIRFLGKGAYAVVCEAKDKRNGKRVAIKKNKGVFDDITDARRILREIKLLMHFHQEDIIGLLDVVAPSTREIDTFNEVYIVMPRMELTLTQVLSKKYKLTEAHFQSFMYQMVRGVHYMHAGGVIHRDLKPDNILINTKDCDLKITDFGLARGVSDDLLENPTEYVVTRWYRSPEVMCSAGFYDEKVDIWSLGCILAEMLLKRPLFPGENYLDQLKVIFSIMGSPRDTSWIKTPEAKRWVLKQRYPGKDLAALFRKASANCLDLIKKMLELNPDVRPGSAELLAHAWFSEVRRPATEVKSPTFDLSFEFEKSIKTRFGVRHMMSQCLVDYEHAAILREREAATKKKRKKKHHDGDSASAPKKRRSGKVAPRV